MKTLNNIKLLICTLLFIIVFTKAKAQCSINAGPDLINCTGTATTTVTFSTLSGPGSYQIVWSPNYGIDDVFSTTPVFSHTGPINYIVTITDLVTRCEASDTILVNTHASNNSFSITQCADSTAINLPLGNSGYLWQGFYDTGGVYHTLSISDYHLILYQSGTYIGQYINSTCGTIIDTYHVTLHPPFRPSFFDIGTNLAYLCRGTSMTLTTGPQASSYTWRDDTSGIIATTEELLITNPGFYSCEVVDLCGNIISFYYSIVDSCITSPACGVTIDSINYYCNGDVVIHTSVTSDVPSYALDLSPAVALGGDSFLLTGYTATTYILANLTTASGCTDARSIVVSPINNIIDTIYKCDTFIRDLLAPYGASSYLWNTGDTNNFIVYSAPGMYYCACFYPSCGIVYDTTYVIARTIYNMPDPLNPTTLVTICIGDTTTLFAGSGGVSYVWTLMDRGMIVTLPDTTESIEAYLTGTYSCTITDACGGIHYLYFIVSNAGCYALVWPGDAGADGIADMYDFLYIASAFGDTGSARVGASSAWIGQIATDWSSYAWGWSPVNAKHADCDGNGVVDFMDFAPLIANYGFVHMRSGEEGSRADDPSIPNVTLLANYDTCGINTMVNVDIQLGDATTPIDSISSIVFEFYFDASLIDTNTVNINYAGSWLGTVGTNMITFQKNLYSSARLDMGASRIDGTNRNGFGKLATVSFVTTDNLSGLAYCPLNIGRYLAITHSGDTVELDAINDTLFIDPNKTTGIQDPDTKAIWSIYPMPASTTLHIEGSDDNIQHVALYDISGALIYLENVNATQYNVDVSHIAPGTYIAEVQGNNHVQRFTFSIHR